MSKQWTAVREKCTQLSQWLSSILGENNGLARDSTRDLLFSSPQLYSMSNGGYAKSIWENEKMIVTSMFYIFHNMAFIP